MNKSKSLKPFLTSAPEVVKWEGGYRGGRIRPGDLATEVFGEGVPGPWLCCYMLRRFGWPNVGGDDYKELMTWALTTPIDGLWLSVTPYLGGSEDNLHFGIYYTKSVNRKIESDPGREAYFRRRYKAIWAWWKTKGIKLYAWGVGLKEGETDELVHAFCDDPENPKRVFGLWKRTEKIKFRGDIPKRAQMAEWWLEELIKAKHPEVKLPKMRKRESERRVNRFQRQVNHALKRTLLDLLRPTNVRDVSFNCFGNTEYAEDSYAKKPKPVLTPYAGYWPGAGNTPQYWYSDDAKKERAEARKKK